MDEKTKQAILEAVGSQSALAEKLGRKQQTVNEWFKKNRIPAHHVLKIVELTGGSVSPHAIRPDVFTEGFCKGSPSAGDDG